MKNNKLDHSQSSYIDLVNYMYFSLDVLQDSEKVFIKNKMSQIIALTFITDYPMKVHQIHHGYVHVSNHWFLAL